MVNYKREVVKGEKRKPAHSVIVLEMRIGEGEHTHN
jgi:hypothetical protein